jgi:hypothetical protein
MSANMNLQKVFPAAAATRDAVFLGATVIFGSSGAVAVVLGDPGVGFELDATGTYILSFPPLNLEQQKRTQITFQAISPALTFVSVVTTDTSTLATGELELKLIKADGTAVEPSAGDGVSVVIKTTRSGTRQ